MIPPTSIDGSDITGATIDGTDVTEITVDGDVVFSAGPKVIDDFETGNLSKWNTNGHAGGTSNFVVNTTNPQEGSFSLETQGSGEQNLYIDRSASQPTPSFGETHEFYVMDKGAGIFFVQWLSDKTESQFDLPTGHWFRIDKGTWEIGVTSSNDFRASNQIGSPLLQNQWYEIKVSYINNNSDMFVEVFDDNGNFDSSETVSVPNQGFGTSCNLHTRVSALARFDIWTIDR